jgi:hypothetical protein
VSEILHSGGAFRAIDEPFHPGRLSLTRAFKPRQYLRPGDRDKRLLDPATRIVSGRVRSPWIDRYNRTLLPRKRLVKETRGNLLLPWLSASFPGMPIVLVIRHPCAVVASQFALEPDWQVDLRRFTSQQALMEDYLEPFGEEIEAAAVRGSEFERHIFAWCIDYFVPLSFFGPGDIHVIFYEWLSMRPAEEVERLFASLRRPVPDGALERVGRPSATTGARSAVLAGDDPVEQWRQDVTPAQLRRGVEIVSMFGLDAIYGEEGRPRVRDSGEALRALSARARRD